jgi:hypothetical protein
MKNKQWWKSLTIISQVAIIGLILLSAFMIANIKPLSYEFTTLELCDWAYATSHNQRILIIQMLIVSCSLVGIYGRKRAKKGIGKNAKK